MITKEVSTKYCKFHDPRCRVSCAPVCVCGGGDTNWRIKFMYDVDDLYQYTLIAIVLKGYMAFQYGVKLYPIDDIS